MTCFSYQFIGSAEGERWLRLASRSDADLHAIKEPHRNWRGDTVIWKFTQKRPETVIEFGVTIKNNETVYCIRDNGAGFDMANAQRLFVPFQRLYTANDFPGTGIGLATAQRVVHRHGGKIWAEGQIDKGATFFFTEAMQTDSAYQSDDYKRPDDHGQTTHSTG
jgi:light-regulated signal transduction histidine kinase (bacteriophytochrome)